MDNIERLFNIRSRVDRKKVLIFGLYEESKCAYMFLAHMGVDIDGFLLDSNHLHLDGIKYIAKPVYGNSIIDKIKEYVIIDIFGKNYKYIKNVYGVESEKLFECKDDIYIYGAGQCGEKAYDFFRKCGIHIKAFVDIKLHGCDYKGIEIVSPTEIGKDTNVPIIVALNDKDTAEQVYRGFVEAGHSKVCCFRDLDRAFRIVLSIDSEVEAYTLFTPFALRYIYKKIYQNQKVFIYGRSISYLKKTLKVLETLGISGCHGVTSSEVSIEPDKANIIYQEELLYKKLDQCLVWVLDEGESDARNFIKKYDKMRDIFVHTKSSPRMFAREYILDVNLGYSDNRGIIRKHTGIKGKTTRIGIVGTSTSDYKLFFEKTWPEYLVELCNKNCVDVEFFFGAVSGYVTYQECMRLIRDLLNYNLDIVIEYSGLENEIMLSEEEYKNINSYQRSLFDYACNNLDKISFGGRVVERDVYLGEQCSDGVRTWINNKRVMKAVCGEFGINFMSFLAPYAKREIVEHGGNKYQELKKEFDKSQTVIRDNYLEKNSWLIDFSEIMKEHEEAFIDMFHLNSNGNEIVAQNIFDLLKRKKWI